MSSPVSQDGSETEAPQQSSGQAQTAVTETTECANCGRTFVGDYCPDCGQEADTTISPFDVIAGFFRELIDLERGFWPTFKGLVLRPRTTLHDYVSGARQRFSHPGRYLMAAIVLAYLSERTLVWTGIRGAYEPPEVATEIGPNPSLEVLLENLLVSRTGVFELLQILYSSQTFLIVASLLLALLVSLMLFQLLRHRLGSGEALAVGAFITGQIILFATLVAWFHDSWMYFGMRAISELPWTGEPSSIRSKLPVRIPFSIYLLFGASWTTGLSVGTGDASLLQDAEPKYFFDASLAWWLSYVAFQHFFISAPIGLLVQYNVFSAGMSALIALLLFPNLAIEVYYRVR